LSTSHRLIDAEWCAETDAGIAACTRSHTIDHATARRRRAAVHPLPAGPHQGELRGYGIGWAGPSQSLETIGSGSFARLASTKLPGAVSAARLVVSLRCRNRELAAERPLEHLVHAPAGSLFPTGAIPYGGGIRSIASFPDRARCDSLNRSMDETISGS
jgi:hypothetical protein